MTIPEPVLSYDHDTKIPFSVDGALLRELGERLIGRPEIALGEVIKNAYDADARHCEIYFYPGSVEIVDNGSGMSQDEFLHFWMRIGSTHKRALDSSPRFGRPLTGQKGIGRLSVQFLGDSLHLYSKSVISGKPGIKAYVNWSEAQEQADLIKATASVRLDRDTGLFANGSRHGTRLKIGNTARDWSEVETLTELAQQIWMLQPPLATDFGDEDNGLTVTVHGLPEDAERRFRDQMRAVLELWRARIKGRIRKGRTSAACKVSVEIRESTLAEGVEIFEHTFPIPKGRIDKASFEILVFDLKHRQSFGISVQEAREYFDKHGGVQVVDTGFRLPYYGQKSSDWLELEVDHARRRDLSRLLPPELQIPGAMLDLPNTRQLYGIVHVDTARERNSAPDPKNSEYLKISPGRDRLLDNAAFETLRRVVRQSIDYFATQRYLLKRRQAAREVREKGDAGEHVTSLAAYVKSIRGSVSESIYEELSSRAEETSASLAATEELALQQRTMLAALATAGMAALAIDHEIRRELGRIRSLITKCVTRFQGHEELEDLLSKLRDWANTTEKAWKVFSPLMSEEDRLDKKNYKLKGTLDNVVRSSRTFLEGVLIERGSIPDDVLLPSATAATWHAIFQNVFINAVNAQIDSSHAVIDCSVHRRGARFFLYIQDKGVGLGLPLEKSAALFEPFERRLEISSDRRGLGLGGTGLGLTIVKMLAESAGCSVYFTEPDEGFSTAFCMEWRGNVRRQQA